MTLYVEETAFSFLSHALADPSCNQLLYGIRHMTLSVSWGWAECRLGETRTLRERAWQGFTAWLSMLSAEKLNWNVSMSQRVCGQSRHVGAAEHYKVPRQKYCAGFRLCP